MNPNKKDPINYEALINALRPDALAVLAHELKNPINVIASSTDLIKTNIESGVPKTIEKNIELYLRYIDESCSKLLCMIDDMIIMARNKDSNAFTVNLVPCDLGEVLQETVERLLPAAEHAFVDLTFVNHLNQPSSALCDPERIEQIIMNLVYNSLKHTFPGDKILVELDIKENAYSVSVSDSGEGIPDACIPHIYDRYQTTGETYNEFTESHGLGLYIVKELVHLHKGTLAVTNVPDSGVMFTFTIPFDLPEEE